MNNGTVKMRALKCGAYIAMLGALSGCGTLGLKLPQTPAARAAGFSYVPIDPLSVFLDPSYKSCTNLGGELNFLHDNSVRIAVSDISAKASVSGGPAGSLGVAGSSYRVVIDYIMADTANQPMIVTKYIQESSGKKIPVSLTKTSEGRTNGLAPIGYGGANRYEARPGKIGEDFIKTMFSADFKECLNPATGLASGLCQQVKRLAETSEFAEEVNIPVYVGVGIRITSNLTVLRGNVALSGLGSLGMSADAKNISGDLVIQTLGISGSKVATMLPLPSELNSTTIQNAITAMATIKAALYTSGDDLVVTPRVVGFYNPLNVSEPEYLNAIVGALSDVPMGQKLDSSSGENSYRSWKPTCARVMPKPAPGGSPAPDLFAMEQKLRDAAKKLEAEAQAALDANTAKAAAMGGKAKTAKLEKPAADKASPTMESAPPVSPLEPSTPR